MNEKAAKIFKRPEKKALIIICIVLVLAVLALLLINTMKGDEKVEFNTLAEKEIPQDITRQVIPEYRTLERALACMVDDKVYVLVSRGEKPTSGFDLAIDKMAIEQKDGMSVLAVYANFTDPAPGTALTQILTYPLKVAETELTTLPDQIDLRVQYSE